MLYYAGLLPSLSYISPTPKTIVGSVRIPWPNTAGAGWARTTRGFAAVWRSWFGNRKSEKILVQQLQMVRIPVLTPNQVQRAGSMCWRIR